MLFVQQPVVDISIVCDTVIDVIQSKEKSWGGLSVLHLQTG